MQPPTPPPTVEQLQQFILQQLTPMTWTEAPANWIVKRIGHIVYISSDHVACVSSDYNQPYRTLFVLPSMYWPEMTQHGLLNCQVHSFADIKITTNGQVCLRNSHVLSGSYIPSLSFVAANPLP